MGLCGNTNVNNALHYEGTSNAIITHRENEDKSMSKCKEQDYRSVDLSRVHNIGAGGTFTSGSLWGHLAYAVPSKKRVYQMAHRADSGIGVLGYHPINKAGI